LQYDITKVCTPQYVSRANLVIAETKHADVQTNGACNVTTTFRCLIQLSG